MKKGCLFVILIWLFYYMFTTGMLQRLSQEEENFEEEMSPFMRNHDRSRSYDSDDWYGGRSSRDDEEDGRKSLWD